MLLEDIVVSAEKYIRFVVVLCVGMVAFLSPCYGTFLLIDDDMDLVALGGAQDVSASGLQSDTEAYLIVERIDYELPSDLEVDVTTSGTYATNQPNETLLAGQKINSYLFHVDPVTLDPLELGTKDPESGDHVVGTIVFQYPVLGIIATDGLLNTSDSLVGNPLSTYSPYPEQRGFWEGWDQFTLSEDQMTLTINSVRVGTTLQYADQIRIITAPEPTTGLLLMGLLSFAGLSRKRRAHQAV